jgi:hypothetical protein
MILIFTHFGPLHVSLGFAVADREGHYNIRPGIKKSMNNQPYVLVEKPGVGRAVAMPLEWFYVKVDFTKSFNAL